MTLQASSHVHVCRVHVAQQHVRLWCKRKMHISHGRRLGRGNSIRQTALSRSEVEQGVTGIGMLRTYDQGPDRAVLDTAR